MEDHMTLLRPPILAEVQNKPCPVLTIPGLGNSSIGHWQTIWEQTRRDCRRIQLGRWNDPLPSVWVKRIDDAVWCEEEPVVLVAHSLGCIALAHWASRHGDAAQSRVRGALLVAPCDPERPGASAELARFAPVPREPLPFPSMLVASSNDRYARIDRAKRFAADWGSALVEVGTQGHINADSGLGAWAFGLELLEELQAGNFAARLKVENYRQILRYGIG